MAADGTVRHLDRDAFTVEVTDRWISPATGADYPAGWTIRIPGDDLVDRPAPTVAAQELDTRATTGVVYWEGSQVVRATRGGVPLGGQAYVELTGYAADRDGQRRLTTNHAGPMHSRRPPRTRSAPTHPVGPDEPWRTSAQKATFRIVSRKRNDLLRRGVPGCAGATRARRGVPAAYYDAVVSVTLPPLA